MKFIMRSAACVGFSCLVALMSLAGMAQEQHTAWRDSLAQQRSAAQERFEAEAAECRQRFVVSSCVDAARLRRRDALGEIDRREVAFDRAQREQAEKSRRERIAAKEAAVAAKENASRRAGGAVPTQDRPAEAARSKPGHQARPAAPRETSAADAAKAADDSEARKRRIEAHRDAVRARNATRNKAPAAPLPLPAASSGGH